MKQRIVINTRPLSDEDVISDKMKGLNITVLNMPLIKTVSLPIEREKIDAIFYQKKYHWLIFTSKNGVDSFFDQIPENAKILPSKIAVYGERTSCELQKNGFTADVVNRGNTAKELVKDLLSSLKTNENVLLVLGNLAPDTLKNGLEGHCHTERLNVYETMQETMDLEIERQILSDKYDLILFTSPSGVESFVNQIDKTFDIKAMQAASIGPVTTAALNKIGVIPKVEANPSGAEGLIEEIKKYFG